MFAPKTILVPTNLSPESENSLRKAVEVACQYGSTIYLLHVIDSNISRRMVQNGIWQEDLMEHIKAMRTQALQEMIERQREAFLPAREVRIVPILKVGLPSSEILREQKERDIDLVVLGSHKRQGLFSRLLSNVADRVVKSASFPALVVAH
jgi:nucleotide-binding universal stress UspA family protein